MVRDLSLPVSDRQRKAPLALEVLMPAHTRSVAYLLAVAASYLVLAAGCGSTAISPPAAAGTPDEDVSVGYGTLRRSDVAGAVWSLAVDERDLPGVGRVHDLLRSRVPGLEVVRRPDGELALRLRGARSGQVDEEPIVVVDGAPIRPGTLDRINPFDVQRIDVLRDVASASIYGSRASGGVILITTRRAR